MKTIGVQSIRAEVGGGDKTYPMVKQGNQKTMQDHGVRDIGHMKLVETDQLVAPGHLLAQGIQGIDRTLHECQFPVHFAHELMEVQAGLALDGQRIKKTVHQEAFATAYPAIHVHPLGNRWTLEKLPQRVGARCLELCPLLRAPLQCFDRAKLGGIALVAALFQLFFVNCTNGHDGSLGHQKTRAEARVCGYWNCTPNHLLLQTPGVRMPQKFSVRLSTASAASFVASDSEGCAWQMRAMSSALARNSMATTASAINSEAMGPTM